MPFQLRRVVTGHDDNGRAVVLIDETATKQVSARPGATAVSRMDDRGISGRQQRS